MNAAIKCILAASLLSAASLVTAHAGIVRFAAVIDASQETNGSDATALGIAMMAYEVESNSFDLVVNTQGLVNTLTNSHIHEAPPGMAGDVTEPLGPEANYTRTGDSVRRRLCDPARKRPLSCTAHRGPSGPHGSTR